MPRRKLKSRDGSSSKLNCSSAVAVTINDFANSESVRQRSSKAISEAHVVRQQAKEFQKSDDADVDDESDDYKTKLARNVKSNVDEKQSSVPESECNGIGHVFPQEVWFLVSTYIRPSDISRFACICKQAYQVTCTRQFWFALYKRHYRSDRNLPESLQPHRMERNYCLKANVIRMLYRLHPPFVHRLKENRTFHCDFSLLVGSTCSLFWHEHNKNQFNFFMKFQRMDVVKGQHAQVKKKRNDIAEDVLSNPDKNCKVLQVSTAEYFCIPPALLGKVLTQAKQSVASDMKHYKIMLSFGSYLSRKNSGFNDDSVVILDQLITVNIRNWWHPSFPIFKY